MVESRCFAAHSKRRILQVFPCGKVELKWRTKVETGMCVNCEATPASLLSSPDIWDADADADAWVWVCLKIQAASYKSVPTTVDNLTLSPFDHSYAEVLSTLVAI